jgi:hypothetical protein
MDAFDVRLPRWPILLRLLGRNRLVRTIDRIEALAFVLLIVGSLVAIPIAAAIGTAVHDSNRRAYLEQGYNRHSVIATVTDVSASERDSPKDTIEVAARWTVAGTEHRGAVKARSTVKHGDAMQIWVAGNGEPVPAPTPLTRAAVEAAVTAFAIWISAAATAATLYALTRATCDRVRFVGWQQDLDNIVGDGDGYPYPGRTSER